MSTCDQPQESVEVCGLMGSLQPIRRRQEVVWDMDLIDGENISHLGRG